MPDPLQDWELAERLRRVEREQAEDELEAAIRLEQGSIPFLQRIRGETGSDVSFRLLGGQHRAGTIQLVASDAVVLELLDMTWLIPETAVVSAQISRVPPALPPRGIERGSMRTVIRRLLDTAVRVDLVDGSSSAGRLTEVGADYLVLTDAHSFEMIPLVTVLALGWQETQLSPKHLMSDRQS